MTTHTCPDGHTSTAADYCDVCGSPIDSGSAAGAASSLSGGSLLDLGSSSDPVAPRPAPAGRTCPNCAAPSAADALFCEHCGYDFTTAQLPQPLAPPPGRSAHAVPIDLRQGDAGMAGADSDIAGAVEVVDVVAVEAPADSSDSAGAAASIDAPVDLDPPVALQPPPSDPADVHLPPSAQTPATLEWVLEVWVDPDWHSAQDIDDPCPSPGMPMVVPLRSRNILVGRTSASRNIHPDIDIAADTGVSRRHAQLTGDGQRWWVEDLASANGTYVGAPGDPLPDDPLAPGARKEIGTDDRIYLGAWSRLVLRRASDAERAAAEAGTL